MIAGLDVSKASGLDGISGRMLKSTAPSIYSSITSKAIQPLNFKWPFPKGLERSENCPHTKVFNKQKQSIGLSPNITIIYCQQTT